MELLYSKDELEMKDKRGMAPKLNECIALALNNDDAEHQGGGGRMANGNQVMEMEITTAELGAQLQRSSRRASREKQKISFPERAGTRKTGPGGGRRYIYRARR